MAWWGKGAGAAAQGAQDQLRVGVDADRQRAASHTSAHKQSAVARDFEPAAGVPAHQRAARADDGSFICKSDLPSMGMAGEADSELLLAQQEQSIGRMRKEDSHRARILERAR